MDQKVKEYNNEVNVIPVLHTNTKYTMTLTLKDGTPLANKSVISRCSPNINTYVYYPNKYREFLLETNENGEITLILDEHYVSDVTVTFLGDEEHEPFVSKYIIYNDELQNDAYELRKKLKIEKESIDKTIEEELWISKQEEYKETEPESIAIELDNIGINFKVTDDKIDNLKEYIIRTIKRNKGETKIFHALQGISFKIHKGEKVGIIGYNGAGKSTLLKIVSGVYTADEGTMKINGNIAPLLSLGAGFDRNYSGRENIFLNGSILGYNEEFLRDKYDEIVEFSGLGDFIKLPVKNYSAGMKAKLGFSIATIVNPDILIIDEVLGVGDINFRKKSREKLQELMESGTTVLLVSHSIEEIRRICDTAIWIDQGKLRDYGEVNLIVDKYIEDAKQTGKIKNKRQRLR